MKITVICSSESIFCKTALFQLQRLYSFEWYLKMIINCEQVRIGKHEFNTHPQIGS